MDIVEHYYSGFSRIIQNQQTKQFQKKKSVYTNKPTGNIWWNQSREEAVKTKVRKYKNCLRNRTELNHAELRRAEINCNKVIPQDEKGYWNYYCTKEITEHKDMYKVWKTEGNKKKWYPSTSVSYYNIKVL